METTTSMPRSSYAETSVRRQTTRMKEKTWLDLMLLPLVLGRRLLRMAVTEAAKRTANLSDEELKKGILDGSSYCAFALAARVRPVSVNDLMCELGTIPAKRQEEVFDATADGFHLFDDARCRGYL
jgi:hypothetical protein